MTSRSMKRGWGMFRRFLVSLTVVAALALHAGMSPAAMLDFIPPSQTVPPGPTVDVELAISGLGDLAAPSLSTFALDVNFNPGILGFNSVTFGDPVLGDQLDLFGLGSLTDFTPGAGSVILFELSFDLPTDLDTLQAGSFTLATLTFDTLGPGTSPLTFSVNTLADSIGDPLPVTAGVGSITVANPIPEPASLLLLGSSLAGFAALRRRSPRRGSGQAGRVGQA